MSGKFIPNSFQVPNALVDLLLAGLSGNAVKCYLLVARQTTGWHKEMDFIPVAQFKERCGIKKDETVAEATAQLVRFGLIEKVEQLGKVTGYKLNFAIGDDVEPPPIKGGTATPEKGVYPKNGTTPEKGGTHPRKRGVLPPPINGGHQNTLQKTLIQKTIVVLAHPHPPTKRKTVFRQPANLPNRKKPTNGRRLLPC